MIAIDPCQQGEEESARQFMLKVLRGAADKLGKQTAAALSLLATAIVPMITNLISGLLAPCFALYACAKSRRYWRQCRRLYTFQPIYRTSGALLAVELLTAVYHPNEPDKRQSRNSISPRSALPSVCG